MALTFTGALLERSSRRSSSGSGLRLSSGCVYACATLSTLSGFYGYAAGEELIARNPVARVRRPRVADESPRFGLDREEVARFLATAERKPRDHALACLLTFNGLRVREGLAADVADLG